jgi:hypothetical protein
LMLDLFYLLLRFLLYFQILLVFLFMLL